MKYFSEISVFPETETFPKLLSIISDASRSNKIPKFTANRQA